MKSCFWVERFDCVNFMLLSVFTGAYDLNLDFHDRHTSIIAARIW